MRGLSDRRRRAAIFDIINRHMPGIVCLLETHLEVDKVKILSRRWVVKEFHSTHSSFSRGVSILIHKKVECEVLDHKIDSQGRYVFLHMRLYGRTFVLAAIYIPPPFSGEVLRQLVAYLKQREEPRVLAIGDFNCVLDEITDRWRQSPVVIRGGSPLAGFLDEFGWVDFWRSRNPEGRIYSCYNKSKQTLSRIDLALGSRDMIPCITKVCYEQRTISDHSPLQISLKSGETYQRRIKINLYILTEDRRKEEIGTRIREFFEINRGTASAGMVWDAFKATIRGNFVELMVRDKRELVKAQEELRAEAQIAAVRFGESGLTEHKEDWERKEEQYKDLVLGNAQTRLFYQDQYRFSETGRPGKFLARLVEGSKGGTTISAVRDEGGCLRDKAEDVRKVFLDFYKTLYKSQCGKQPEAIGGYMSDIPLPKFSEEAKKLLGAEITIEEIEKVIQDSPLGKAAGPDALPFELYRSFPSLLAPELLQVYREAEEIGKLPPSMYGALISLILKPGKDEHEPGSYRPISLLNVDQKILAKVLTNRLASVVSEVIAEDQKGFMAGCTTSDNIRRLYANILYSQGGRSILSLDAVKAFDRVEWPFLWEVMAGFGVGERFIGWLKVLYKEPRAAVLVNGQQTEEFLLRRGTRQGCPLSPLIFALYIEPLAIKLRMEGGFEGFGCGGTEDRLSLYADDILLYIRNAKETLGGVMGVIKEFGEHSGLEINWQKTILLPLEEEIRHQELRVLKRGESFRYLGIEVSAEPKEYVELNVKPLLQKIRRKCNVWMCLPIGMMDRISLVKMIILPQVLYVFKNSPSWIGKNVFKQLKSIITEFIWRARRPRIKMEYLHRDIKDGGLGIPDWELYFISSHLVDLIKWSDKRVFHCMVNKINGAYEDVWEWLEAGPQDNKCTILEDLFYRVWGQCRKKLKIVGALDFTPMFNNSNLKELYKIKDFKWWHLYGLRKVSQFCRGGRLRELQELQEICGVSSFLVYRYIQIKHAFSSSQREGFTVTHSHFIMNLRLMRVNKKALSKIYKGLQREMDYRPHRSEKDWENDIGLELGELWHGIWRWAREASINRSHVITQFFTLRRLYVTPRIISKYKNGEKKECPKCAMEEAGFLHMIFECRPIRQFWEELDETIRHRLNLHEIGGISVKLMGNMVEVKDGMYRSLLNKIYFAARLGIAKRWMAREVPSVKQVLNKIRQMINYEYVHYVKMNNEKKFYTIWRKWVEAMSISEKMGLIQGLR